jgi:hypothetical protein
LIFDMLAAQKRVFASGLKPLERLVALALVGRWSRSSPRPFAGVDVLAADTGLDRKAVMRALGGLRAAGAIEVHGGERRRTFYELAPLMLLVPQRDQSPTAPANGSGPPEGPELVPQRDHKEPTKEPMSGSGARGRAREPGPGRFSKATPVPEGLIGDPRLMAGAAGLAFELGVPLDVVLAAVSEQVEFASAAGTRGGDWVTYVIGRIRTSAREGRLGETVSLFEHARTKAEAARRHGEASRGPGVARGGVRGGKSSAPGLVGLALTGLQKVEGSKWTK